MSQCNYCTLKGVKERAKVRGQTVTVKSDDFGMRGLSAYVHEPDRDPDTSENSSDRAVWFMELTDECVCG